MSDNRKPQIEPQVKTDQAVAGFNEIGKAADDMGKRVKGAGTEAAKGVDGIGEGAQPAAQKLDRATKSIIGSIERTTAALQAGERGSASYFETLAKQRGISGDALAPYIAQLRQAEAAQKAATASLGGMEVSAKQTAAALRNVPAQFTDIVVSLQAGQAPLTVLLQQGGQLKDMFGGIGNATQALGGYILGLVNPFTLAAAAAAALGAGYFFGAKEAQEFNRTLVLTGNQAGTTVGQLSAMAERLDALGTTQGKASEVLTAFAQSGRVGAESLERFTLAAINLEKVGGPAVEETVKAFAELGKDPLAASIKLNESTNFLTRSLYDQIQALTDQGRTLEAAKVAQEAYSAAVEGRTPQIVAQLGFVERAWRGIVDMSKEAIDGLKSIGRQDSIEELRTAANNARVRAQQAGSGGLLGVFAQNAAKEAQAALDAALKQAEAEEKIAQEKRKQAEQSRALAAADKELEALGIKRVTAAQQEDALRTRLLAAGKDELTIQKAIAAFREKNAPKKGDANNSAARELEREADVLAELSGLTKSYNNDLKLLQSSRAKGNITEAQYVGLVGDLISKQPFAVKLEQERAEAQKASAKALDDLLKADERYLTGLAKSSEAVQKQILALEDEEAASKIAAAGQLSLAQAIQQVVIARLEESKAKATALGDFQTAAALAEEIAAREKLADLIGSQESRKAAAEAAKDAATEWKRAAQDIERSLTDALLRGFESGKDFAKNLRDTLFNMFKTMVIRPIIQPIVGGITGALGLAGPASAAGQGASALSGLSTIGSLASLGTLITNGVTGSLAGLIGGAGNLFGSSALSAFATGMKGSTLAAGLAGPTTAGATGALGAGASFGSFISAALPFVGAGALIGNAIGLFRSNRTVGAGITGQLGGTVEDFSVNRRGGTLFRGPSYSTPTTGVSGFNADLQSTFDALRQNAALMAEALGLSGAAARSFVTAIGSDKLSDDTGGQGLRLEGLSADQVTAKLQEELTKANERLAEAVLGTAGRAFAKTGETAAQTLERLSGSLQGVNDTLGVLGQSLLQVGISGGNTASQLLEQFGGLQQFQSAAGQFLADYYTEAEKTALATQELTRQLATVGVALPASRDAYRDLVEAQDLNTEAGRKAYAALLQLAPSFAELVPAVELLGDSSAETARQAAEAAAQIAEAGQRMLESIATDRERLEVDLLRAQGNEAGALARDRANTLARSTAGLNATDTAAVTAALAYNNALQDQITALRAAAEAQRTAEQVAKQAQEAAERLAQQAIEDAQRRADAILGERTSLEDRLLQLQGDTAALRARELAGIDASNRALLERIFALQDAQTAEQAAAEAAATAAEATRQAADAAAQALDALNGKLNDLASTRFDLENELLGLNGNAGEVARRTRERDLAGLTAGLSATDAARVTAAYDYNVALRQQIEATTAAQEAAQKLAEEQTRAADEAQRAAEQFRDAWQSITDTLFDEVARIRGLLGIGSGDSLASAQSRFAITTAQARAGDQEAAKLLPGLSQTLLELAGANATSLLELQRIRAQVAASLEQTGTGLAGRFGLKVPSFDVGTNYVPLDMLALVHEGEAIVPKAYNAEGGAGSVALVAEVRGLREDNRAQALAIVRLQTDMNRMLKRWDGEGLPKERVEV
jgi:phage-related minor tail protein